MESLNALLLRFLDNPWNIVGAALLAFVGFLAFVFRQPVWFNLKFMLKSLRRNLVRTVLTGLATMVLVFVVTLVWSVFALLDKVTAAKSRDFKAIVTEKWQIPSMMPYAYANSLTEGAPSKPGDYRVDTNTDAMTWQFYGGTLDPANRTRENIVFFFCMEPDKLLKMMDGTDEFTDQQRADLDRGCKEMEKDLRKVIVGIDRLKALNKKVGETFTVSSFNYKDIDLEVQIIGTFPDGRYNQSALMNRDYLNRALDDYERKKGQKHPMAEKTLALVWLRVPDTAVFNKVASQIQEPGKYTTPAVKCETASSGIASWLDAYKDLLSGMRYLLVPAVLVTMALVIANAISISVRERRTEMAVLKVLGFGPGQVMLLVLGEAVLIGCLSGLASAGCTWLIVNQYFGGFKFPIAFFPAFLVPADAWWWGATLGGLTALAGSLVPSWSARQVKVAEVFAKIS
jgi:putative ABC transport system permease protein